MAITFGFFSDAALTTPITARLPFSQADTSPTAADKVVYFGSPVANRQARANSNPGVAPIVISITDAVPAAGSPAANVKLALSAAGLASASGGAALSLPAVVDSATPIAIHIRVLDTTHIIGINNDLSLTTNMLQETEV